MAAMPGPGRPRAPSGRTPRLIAASAAAAFLLLLTVFRGGGPRQQQAAVQRAPQEDDWPGSERSRSSSSPDSPGAAGAAQRRADGPPSRAGGASGSGSDEAVAAAARRADAPAGQGGKASGEPRSEGTGQGAAAVAAAAAAAASAAVMLEEVPRVDIRAAANRFLNWHVLLRAEGTPLKKCKVTSYAAEAFGDAQMEGALLNSTRLGGQVLWANVSSVPCRKDGVAGCCTRPFSFRYATTDIRVFRQIFRDHYLRALYSLFPEDAAPKYILDAGANAGYATSLFKLLWPEAVVVSLEPDPSNFAALQRNTAGFDGVHPLNAGLWGRTANITLSSGGCLGCEWGKTFREAREGESGIPAYSVDDLARMFDIPAFDFVKIDVEGAEGQVFAPGADLSWVGKPKVVSLEVHDFFAHLFGLTAVSGRVNATFAPHTQYQIAADNEHVFYISREQLSAARLLATVRQGGGA